MALKDLMKSSNPSKKMGISEERIQAVLPHLRQYIAFWREYPDLMVDFMQVGIDQTKKKDLNFFFYQRVFIRAAIRYKYTYMTFPRAYSKSFLCILVLMLRCILYPGAKLFVTSGNKQQASDIMREKVTEICNLVPAFDKELDRRPGKTRESKDYCVYIFKNKSFFDNIVARESSRGKRRHSGLVEECVGVDGDILQQVIIPTMNVSRRCLDGSVHPEETINKAQIFVTTAGYKNTYAYDKLIQTLVWMITQPEKAITLGGTWRTPVLFKLLDKNFVSDLKADGTFNEIAFEREYESKWLGSTENAFFRAEAFDRSRKLAKPEYEFSAKSAKAAKYYLSVDVGRKGCDTVICVLKTTPQSQGVSIKSLVNIVVLPDTHFEDQAVEIKKLYYKYKAQQVVIDGNGMGIGLIDYMVKSQTDSYGDFLPDFGISNDSEGYYKKFRTENTEYDAVYIIKANPAINTEAHANIQSQLVSGKLKFLEDEKNAKAKLLRTKMGTNMRSEERQSYLMPFTLTSVLREEMLNLREENEGVNIILKRANKTIKQDKFSSLEYGLYYIKQLEDSKKKRHHGSIADFMFIS